MTIWPLYVVGAYAQDQERRQYVTGRLENELLYRYFKSKNLVGDILKETWKRGDCGDPVTPDTIAKERHLELGIW
jgi:hypothetical protein